MPDATSPKDGAEFSGIPPDEQAAFAHYVAVGEAYMARFGHHVPQPAMVSFEAVTVQMEKALKLGKPISHNHDWWSYLPPGADA
ncbi:hypothetical protein [Inhella crocodyli]|uniref:Uncharacterized protein n=1 Tax=Inhella crocodyli TaxID=2499851 RepID=A0A437LAP2_9BURK|nr:hypothetical protein [Inhella crocodyli]RVT82456.1 hypothetical protein EOD73_17130 [Inhella crocodyli]